LPKFLDIGGIMFHGKFILELTDDKGTQLAVKEAGVSEQTLTLVAASLMNTVAFKQGDMISDLGSIATELDDAREAAEKAAEEKAAATKKPAAKKTAAKKKPTPDE
jgi:hypothetical protein